MMVLEIVFVTCNKNTRQTATLYSVFISYLKEYYNNSTKDRRKELGI